MRAACSIQAERRSESLRTFYGRRSVEMLRASTSGQGGPGTLGTTRMAYPMRRHGLQPLVSKYLPAWRVTDAGPGVLLLSSMSLVSVELRIA